MTDEMATRGRRRGLSAPPAFEAVGPSAGSAPRACCLVDVVVVDQVPDDLRAVAVDDAFECLTGVHWEPGASLREIAPQLALGLVEVAGRAVLPAPTSVPRGSVQGSCRRLDVWVSRAGGEASRQVFLVCVEVPDDASPDGEPSALADPLDAQDARFRVFADTAPAMLWVTERDGACSYLSRGWLEFTGQGEAEGLGYGWLTAVHPDDREEARAAFLRANECRGSFALEHRLRRADGAYRWVIDAGHPRIGADGRFEGYVGSVIDIHDRKVAEDRLDLAVNSAGVGLWYCDLPFDRLVWNAHVKAHFGLPADAVVTIDTFFDRLHPEDREPTRLAIERSIADHSTYDTQYRTVDEQQRIRWIRAIGRTHYDNGHPIRFDGITVDITEMVMLREQSDAANRAKDEFLAMLGHELRNPLAPILTAVQLLALRRVPAIEREREIIERQVNHLVRLVDDLLDVSRITSGRIQLHTRPVDLRDVVAKAIEFASPLLEQHRHQLRVQLAAGLHVAADPDRLAQVVANLLTNAAKYTEPGGLVTIEAHAEPGEVALSVSDTGVGIEPDMLPRVFELFVQERQSLARSQGGLGLGLAIVRSLVALHGGTVTAASRGRGQGSVFTVRLPRVAFAEDRPLGRVPAAVIGDSPWHGTRVLVVDDNEDAARLLGSLLRSLGYSECVVHDGPSAIAAVDDFAPDIALVDIGLPVMDGYDLAERIRARPGGAAVRLVAVSGYGQSRDRDASTRAGFAAHLVKPVDASVLRALLSSMDE